MAQLSIEQELEQARGRIRVLEMELQELRELKQRHLSYGRKHRVKRKMLAQLAEQLLSQDEIEAVAQQAEQKAYE